MDEQLQACERAARRAGRVLREWQTRIRAREKAPKDLVTEADLASQRVIHDVLMEAFPGYAFIGEEDIPEQRQGGAEDAEYAWIVDPLDGTTNYVHQMPSYSISIALARRGVPVVGLVYDPVSDECFTACRGGGAYLNGERLHASDCVEMSQALVASSFSTTVRADSAEVRRFVAVLVTCQALRRLGSAALNLCYLAAGRLDAYWATSVKKWDVAAGVLLVEEAGGTVTGSEGGTFDLERPRFAAACTKRLHAELLGLLQV